MRGKMNSSRIIVIIIAISVCVLIAIRSGGAADRRAPIAIVFDGTNDERAIKNWSEPIAYREIARRARVIGAEVLSPGGAGSPRMARFVRKNGSTVRIDGLDGSSPYWLWLDYVSYSRLPGELQGWLDVIIDGKPVASIGIHEIAPASAPRRIAIPYECTADGSILVEFRDRSYASGLWGLWGLAVSDSDTVPGEEQFAPRRDGAATGPDVTPRILERKRDPVKAPAGSVRRSGEDK